MPVETEKRSGGQITAKRPRITLLLLLLLLPHSDLLPGETRKGICSGFFLVLEYESPNASGFLARDHRTGRLPAAGGRLSATQEAVSVLLLSLKDWMLDI